MKTLTIITTTYNRAYCIGQLYESLKKQDSDDFCWLVVDDGSTDNTRETIDGFINEGIVDIEYIYQENKGMTGARNTAYNACKTEINTIIDSDDWLADGAVSQIIQFWNANKREDIAGIIAQDINPNGKVIGSNLPANVKETTSLDLRDKYGVRGDKKLIYRSDISRKYPYPEYPGEKFFPPSYKFLLIDQTHKMLLLNCGVCVVDYNDDSMSFDKIAQYRSCSNGFAEYFNLATSLYSKPVMIIKNCLMYIACSKLARRKNIIKNATKPFLTFFLYPIGTSLYFYLKITKRKALRIPKKH